MKIQRQLEPFDGSRMNEASGGNCKESLQRQQVRIFYLLSILLFDVLSFFCWHPQFSAVNFPAIVCGCVCMGVCC